MGPVLLAEQVLSDMAELLRESAVEIDSTTAFTRKGARLTLQVTSRSVLHEGRICYDVEIRFVWEMEDIVAKIYQGCHIFAYLGDDLMENSTLSPDSTPKTLKASLHLSTAGTYKFILMQSLWEVR